MQLSKGQLQISLGNLAGGRCDLADERQRATKRREELVSDEILPSGFIHRWQADAGKYHRVLACSAPAATGYALQCSSETSDGSLAELALAICRTMQHEEPAPD